VWLGRPGNATVKLLYLSVYKDSSTQNHHVPPHVLPRSILLGHLLLRSDPMLRQSMPLLCRQETKVDRWNFIIIDYRWTPEPLSQHVQK
jgi:hypothetical protein